MPGCEGPQGQGQHFQAGQHTCAVDSPLNSYAIKDNFPVAAVRSVKTSTSTPNSDISLLAGSVVRYMLVWRWVICIESSIDAGRCVCVCGVVIVI